MSDSILDMVDAHLAKKMRLTKREFFAVVAMHGILSNISEFRTDKLIEQLKEK